MYILFLIGISFTHILLFEFNPFLIGIGDNKSPQQKRQNSNNGSRHQVGE